MNSLDLEAPCGKAGMADLEHWRRHVEDFVGAWEWRESQNWKTKSIEGQNQVLSREGWRWGFSFWSAESVTLLHRIGQPDQRVEVMMHGTR